MEQSSIFWFGAGDLRQCDYGAGPRLAK
jgi:hypothetical protein